MQKMIYLPSNAEERFKKFEETLKKYISFRVIRLDTYTLPYAIIVDEQHLTKDESEDIRSMSGVRSV